MQHNWLNYGKILICQFILTLFFIGKINAAEISLDHWPEAAAAQLKALIEKNANQGQFAVFDMDNTAFQYDVSESLLPYLENEGVLTRDNLDPSLEFIPFRDENGVRESLFSYYSRLCDMGERICYPWGAQSFAGLTLREMKTHVDAMMKSGAPIPVSYWKDDEYVQDEVRPPRLFTGQQELFKALMDNGIEVYIVSASHEELVRMVASDPQYGYNVKPENVLGVTTYLRDRQTGGLTTSEGQIAAGTFVWENNFDLELTAHLGSPATWIEGKASAILDRIDRWRQPILAAGDNPHGDGYMLMNSLHADGLKLWVDRSERHMRNLQNMMASEAQKQQELGMPVTADKNWVMVKPQDIY